MTFNIETDRLLLRELRDSDLEGMFELDSNPNVHRYLGNKPIKTKQYKKIIKLFQMISKLITIAILKVLKNRKRITDQLKLYINLKRIFTTNHQLNYSKSFSDFLLKEDEIEADIDLKNEFLDFKDIICSIIF